MKTIVLTVEFVAVVPDDAEIADLCWNGPAAAVSIVDLKGEQVSDVERWETVDVRALGPETNDDNDS